MPLLEAFPSENQIMKYKLTTLPRGTAKLPVLDLGYAGIVLKQGAQLSITPQTLNYLGNEQIFETSGYSATIGDVRLMNTFVGQGIQTDAAITANATATTTIGTSISKTVIGTQINLTATTVNTLFGSLTQLKTTLTVTGLDSGARLTIPVTVTQQALN
jgi:Lhr-like helicase